MNILNCIVIHAKIVPQSKINAVENVIINDNGVYSLKARVSAPAVDGKANEALINLLAKHFNVKKSNVEIVKGHTNRQKIINVYNPSVTMAQQTLILK